ncbi:MAG: NAD/NADP octopine/nopaline dehydrogenase family protein [Deltaproteobacteria bacterium]|nr:NAD/NADP octopine/nopaline dehydrogenase family protein [Deltaproteobacteria bacterium]
MRGLPNVTVCGCGNAGMAIAADVALMGCTVNLYELPDFEKNLDPVRQRGGIVLTGTTCSGKNGFARMEKITSDAESAVEDAELIMITVPAFGHEAFFEALLPHLKEGQMILFNTGYWASLRIKELLKKKGLTSMLDIIILAEEHIMPYLSRVIEPAHAHIFNYKRDIRISAWPATKNEAAFNLVKKVYPQMSLSKNVIENNFYPGNPSVHAQITIPKAEFFFEKAKEFRFYGEVSQCASKLTDAFDRERIKVAAALDCDVTHSFEWFRNTYLYEGKDIYEIFGNVTCEHARRWSTEAGNRRVLHEDICYFLIPMEQIATVLKIDVPVTRAIIEIVHVFTDFDYRSHGITLKDLGMDGLTTREQMLEYVIGGVAS